jgi:hypothetical protein
VSKEKDTDEPTSKRKPSYLNFDKASYAWSADIDYQRDPEKYRVGKGEQGVLICQPYKSEMVPLWKFKTPAIAKESSKAIYERIGLARLLRFF